MATEEKTRFDYKDDFKEMNQFLTDNERITSDLMGDVLDKLWEKAGKAEDGSKIVLIESEDKLGLIIDVIDPKGEVIEEESVTYWFDDYV